MKKFLHLLLILVFLLQMNVAAFAAAGPVVPPPEEEPVHEYESRDARPILDSFSYEPSVITVPPLNSGPNPVMAGDELVQVAYVDDIGQLYDTQANLTKKQLKIFFNGEAVASSVLSDSDAAIFRNAGQSVDNTKLAYAIIGGVIAGLVFFAVSIAYNEMIEDRNCSRNIASAWNSLAGDMRACKLRGGSFVVTNAPSQFDCGASASSTCN